MLDRKFTPLDGIYRNFQPYQDCHGSNSSHIGLPRGIINRIVRWVGDTSRLPEYHE
jgi:hypothetical protein